MRLIIAAAQTWPMVLDYGIGNGYRYLVYRPTWYDQGTCPLPLCSCSTFNISMVHDFVKDVRAAGTGCCMVLSCDHTVTDHKFEPKPLLHQNALEHTIEINTSIIVRLKDIVLYMFAMLCNLGVSNLD